MSNIAIRVMDHETWYLVEEFCKEEGFACPPVDHSHVVGAIDLDTGKLVGVATAQFQIHTEPMWIKKEYQGKGLWQELGNRLEWYLDMIAIQGGGTVGVWCQPTNAAAERICRMRGFRRADLPVWIKVYDGSGLLEAGKELINQLAKE